MTAARINPIANRTLNGNLNSAGFDFEISDFDCAEPANATYLRLNSEHIEFYVVIRSLGTPPHPDTYVFEPHVQGPLEK